MAVTPSLTAINRLKRMAAADNFPTLSTQDVTDALIMYALADAANHIPNDVAWLETYDWYGAAAECWGWKEGKASDSVNMNADGRQASLSDIAEHCREKRKEYLQRRMTGSIRVGVA